MLFFISMINYNKLIDSILSKVTEVEIFSYYLKIPISEINNCIENNVKVSNPLSVDDNPSLSFKYLYTNKGVKLRATDFANSSFRGDFIDFVGIVLGKSANNKHAFIEIATDILRNIDKIKSSVTPIQVNDKSKKFTQLTYITRKWLYPDYNYWQQFNVPINYIKEYVTPILSITKNGNLIYYYKPTDTAYLYKETQIDDKIISKFYLPLRSKHGVKFITNNNIIPFDAVVHLRYTGYLLIIKSYKDFILLQYVLNELGITNVDIIPIASESHIISKTTAKQLKKKYIDVFTLFDFDLQGVKQSNLFRKLYKFKPLFITNGRFSTDIYSGKDIAEVLANSEYDIILQIIKLQYVRLTGTESTIQY